MVAVQIDKSISRYYIRFIIRQTFEIFWLKISFSVNCALMFACELPKRGAGSLLLLLCSIGSLELKLSRFLYIFTRFVFYLLLYSPFILIFLTRPSKWAFQGHLRKWKGHSILILPNSKPLDISSLEFQNFYN